MLPICYVDHRRDRPRPSSGTSRLSGRPTRLSDESSTEMARMDRLTDVRSPSSCPTHLSQRRSEYFGARPNLHFPARSLRPIPSQMVCELVLSIEEAMHEPRAGQHCTLPNLNYGARVRPKACQARAPPRPGPRFTPRRGCHSSCHLAHGSNESAVRRWSAMHHGDYIGCRRCPLRMRTCACPMTGCGVRSPGPVRGRFSPGRYPRVRSSSEGVRGAGGEVLRSSLSYHICERPAVRAAPPGG